MKKTLYKKDSKGKIRIFQIWTDGAILLQQSGLNEGKQVLQQKVCKPKNVGKSNEINATNQATLELESRYKKKIDEGYFDTKKKAEENEVILPMLAKPIEDIESKVDWKTSPFAQPKLDGMRCLAIITADNIRLISRKGKEIETLPHILEDLKKVQEWMISMKESRWIIDGELYAHGLSFQENMKLIKKHREESIQIKYHVYDMVLDAPFAFRYGFLSGVIIKTEPEHIIPTDTMPVDSKKALDRAHTKWLNEGYEGTILRHTNDSYKINVRASQLLKYKDFQDIAATIIDIEPGKQRPTWGVPVLRYSVKKLSGTNEYTFRAGTKMSHKDKEELLKNREEYIGKTAEIRFFEYTDEGKPRFPIMVGIRLDK